LRNNDDAVSIFIVSGFAVYNDAKRQLITVQSLAIAASPLHTVATWFYSALPSVSSLASNIDRYANDKIGQSSMKQILNPVNAACNSKAAIASGCTAKQMNQRMC
jgi:hypothetical protein